MQGFALHVLTPYTGLPLPFTGAAVGIRFCVLVEIVVLPAIPLSTATILPLAVFEKKKKKRKNCLAVIAVAFSFLKLPAI